jgi:hypothetical protein
MKQRILVFAWSSRRHSRPCRAFGKSLAGLEKLKNYEAAGVVLGPPTGAGNAITVRAAA